jgi:DeoR/GlpR family transcriptional regulator of sugar metabolism
MDPLPSRHNKILEAVVEAGEVAVSALADSLQVSQVTIRKDLDELEARGLIRRERGVAVLVSADDPAGRLAYHYADKRRIARAAAATVQNGEFVLIESGSCCVLLAEEIAATRPGATIVTNSAFIAERVRKLPLAHIILLGGEYQNDSQVLVGPITRLCAQQFYAERLFIGTDGFTPGSGFTARDHMRAETVRDLAERARTVVVLTESEKFGRRGPVPLLSADAVSTVWTDPALPPQDLEFLEAHHVTVNLVTGDGGRLGEARAAVSGSGPGAGR